MATSPQTGQHIVGAQAEGHQILGNNFSAGGNNIININNAADGRRQCLVALFTTNPIDDRAKYISFKGEVIGAAFTWIVQSKTYRDWLNTASGSQLLWLHGRPGMGKTMLSIFLSTEFEKLSECHVLYYFCESRDPKRNTAVSVLRGLIYTLVRHRPSLISYLLPDYEVQQNALFGPDSVEALWRIFTQMVKDAETGTIYCVIDALDECQGDLEHLAHLLKKFRSYFANDGLTEKLERASLNSSKGVLKLALISRDSPTCMVDELSEFPRITLGIVAETRNSQLSDGAKSKDEPQSLDIYIDVKLGEFVSRHGYDSNTRDLIRQNLKQRGDGTFLWVDMAIAQLNKVSSEDLLGATLPQGTEGMYYLTLLQVPEESTKLATSILRWVTGAVRPLTLTEIQCLGEIVYGQEEWAKLCKSEKDTNNELDGAQPYLKQLIISCNNLLDINFDGEVKLVHETAKAFLIDPTSQLLNSPHLRNFHITEAVVHGEIAQACIRYIETSPYNEEWVYLATIDEDPWDHSRIEANQTKLEEFPFLLYASTQWPTHQRQAQRGSVKFDSLFFDSSNKIFQNWWISVWSYTYRRAAGFANTQTLLHVAAYFDLVEIVMDLTARPGFVTLAEKTNGDSDTPSYIAAHEGSVKVLEVLIDHGIKQNNYYGPYIDTASERGHVQAVKLYLDRGWSPDTTMKSHTMLKKGLLGLARHTPEKWWKGMAQLSGDHDSVELIPLFRLNIGVNETILHTAAGTGHDGVVRLLLERQANVHTTTSTGWTAVHFAAYNGQPSVIELLRSHGAALDAVTVDGWTPLHCAAYHSEDTGIQYLLDHGVPIDAADKKGDTPLHVAATRGRTKAAAALLNRGARIDWKNKHGLVPLQRVPAKVDADLKRLLEDRQAQPSS